MPNHGKLRDMLLSSAMRGALSRGLVLIAVGAALASCSSAGETTRNVMRNMNPMNWFEDEADEKSDKKALANKGEAKGEKPYPKLGSVPQRPNRPTPEEQARKISEGLVADTENARYTDQQLRQNTNDVVGNPPGTSKIPLPTSSRPVAPPVAAQADSRIVPPPLTPPAPPAEANRVAPPAVRPPQASAEAPAPPPVAPPARVPEPRQTAAVAPPTVRPPVAAPSVPPPVGQPPAVRPPPVRAPEAVEAPKPVAPPAPPPASQQAEAPRRVAPPLSSGPSQGDSSGQFATPSGTPSESPRPAPAPEPLRGPAAEQTVRVSPPQPARMAASSEPSANESKPSAQMKTLQVGTIYFANGSAELTGRDVSVIEAVMQVARQTGGRIRIVGHSSMGARSVDPERREVVNFQMSLKRANAVASELVRQGIPAERVEVIAQGDHEPIYAETSATGAAYNRRAEIFVDYMENS